MAPDIRSVHVKDAKTADDPRAVGPGSPARVRGRSTSHRFIKTLKAVGYDGGASMIEREVGDQAGRIADVKHGLDFLHRCLLEPSEPNDAVPGVHNSEQLRGSD